MVTDFYQKLIYGEYICMHNKYVHVYKKVYSDYAHLENFSKGYGGYQ